MSSKILKISRKSRKKATTDAESYSKTLIGCHPTSRRGEVKWRSRPLTTSFGSIGSSTIYFNFTPLSQGTEMTQRVGRHVFARYIDILGTLTGGQNNTVGDDVYNTINMAVCIVSPGFSDSSWSVNGPIGPEQIPGVQKVLWLERRVINAPARDLVGYVAHSVSVSVRVPLNVVLSYTASGEVAAANVGLAILMCSDSVAVSHPGFTSGYFLLAFDDN